MVNASIFQCGECGALCQNLLDHLKTWSKAYSYKLFSWHNRKPLKVTTEILRANDLEGLKELISLFEVVFKMKPFKRPSDQHLSRLLADPHFFCGSGKGWRSIIGGLTVYLLEQYYAESPLAYIYDLAVLETYQRKGVGKRLVAYTIEHCKGKGFEEVFVQADMPDDYAIDFYRKTYPTREEQVVHFSYELHE